MIERPFAANLPIAQIRMGDRLRDVDKDNVDMLAVSMEDYGLLSPLWVREPDSDGQHDLIAGAHRLAAALQLGWDEVPALVFSVEGRDARLMEIDENLFRRELSPLDRAVFLAERKAVYEALHPEVQRGATGLAVANDHTDKLVSMVPSFADATAVKLGIDARTVFRAIARARNIAPDVRKTIATTWIAAKGSALDALARLQPDDQRAIVALMLAEGGPKAVSAALAQRNGATMEQDDSGQQLAALMKAWRRADKRARDSFVTFLADEGALTTDMNEAA